MNDKHQVENINDQYSHVDPVIAHKVKSLTMQYTNRPQPELLMAIPNPAPTTDYQLEIISQEFTSQCPLAPTQPDFATVTITYKPLNHIVELKTLKFYLTSFRNVAIFHEAVASKILEDLAKAIQPHSMRIHCQFTTRGGINTNIEAVYSNTRSLK